MGGTSELSLSVCTYLFPLFFAFDLLFSHNFLSFVPWTTMNVVLSGLNVVNWCLKFLFQDIHQYHRYVLRAQTFDLVLCLGLFL